MANSFLEQGNFVYVASSSNIRLILTKDVGVMKGKYYSLNFPLRDGISDENYKSIFEPVGLQDSVRT